MQEQSSSEQIRSSHTESASYAVRRYYKRQEGARRWWPFGILPLLLLGLLFLFGILVMAPDMQEDTRSNVESALRTVGYEDLNVVADGQRVLIKGTADADESEIIRNTARGAICDTFLAKEVVCPTSVEVDLESKKATEHFDFSFVRTANGLILRGEVPGSEVHDQLLTHARAQFEAVVDSLRIRPEGEDERYDWATSKALSLLEGVNAGRAVWEGGVLSLVARTRQENESRIRDMFSSDRFPGRMGALELQFENEIELCNTRLKNTLAETLILFETASAVISDESTSQLAEIANIAMECPGDLVVEGHTDDIGDDASNLSLSQRRAEAVAQALTQQGVKANRLSAIGYGETRPLMSNETPAGRAMNRRIAIQIADFN